MGGTWERKSNVARGEEDRRSCNYIHRWPVLLGKRSGDLKYNPCSLTHVSSLVWVQTDNLSPTNLKLKASMIAGFISFSIEKWEKNWTAAETASTGLAPLARRGFPVIYLSVCLSICLSVYVSVFLSVPSLFFFYLNLFTSLIFFISLSLSSFFAAREKTIYMRSYHRLLSNYGYGNVVIWPVFPKNWLILLSLCWKKKPFYVRKKKNWDGHSLCKLVRNSKKSKKNASYRAHMRVPGRLRSGIRSEIVCFDLTDGFYGIRNLQYQFSNRLWEPHCILLPVIGSFWLSSGHSG